MSTSNGAVSAPAAALNAARVDLLALIESGIPDREWVPGSPMFIKGKRYLTPAGAGTGKSLATLVMAVDIVDAGGTVVIIDVENGANEYARRLAMILDDRLQSARDACRAGLRYYAYPALSAGWSAAEWAGAVAGADVVIFDSSRNTLSSIGLGEDKADEYATFVNALLMPLSRAGITSVVLDNTGHTENGRARGSSTKGDLNEVTYTAKKIGDITLDETGKVEFSLARSRFPEQPARLTMTLGGGTYGALTVDDEASGDDWRPTILMGRLIETAKANPGTTRTALVLLTKGKNETLRQALTFALADGYLETRRDGHKECIWWTRDLDSPTVPDGPGPVPDPANEWKVPVPPSNTGTGDLSEDRQDRLLRDHADIGGTP